MKVIGSVNKISEDLKKKIVPLKKGEQAHYRLLTGEYDLNTEERRYGSQLTIVCRDRIYDAGTGNVVDIAVVKSHADGQVTRAKKFYIAPVGENLLNNGVFTLQGGNLEHQEYYEFFELSNFNKNSVNPDRDESILPMFERIDEVKEAEEEEVEIDTLTKALILASQMTAADIKSFASGKNWNVKEKPAVLRSRVKKYAQENPLDFVQSADDPEVKNKVTIKQAMDAGVISYQPADHKIVWQDGKTLALLDKPENGESEVELFNAWLQASKNGDNILKSIATKLKNSTKE